MEKRQVLKNHQQLVQPLSRNADLQWHVMKMPCPKDHWTQWKGEWTCMTHGCFWVPKIASFEGSGYIQPIQQRSPNALLVKFRPEKFHALFTETMFWNNLEDAWGGCFAHGFKYRVTCWYPRDMSLWAILPVVCWKLFCLFPLSSGIHEYHIRIFAHFQRENEQLIK